MEEKRNRGLIITICILFLCVLGLGGYIVYDKVFDSKNANESTKTNDVTNPTGKTDTIDEILNKKYKEFVINYNDKQNNCEPIASRDYYDYDNSYKVIVNGIKLNNNESKLELIRDYNDKKDYIYLNDKRVISTDVNENLFSKVCVYNNHIFVDTDWEFMTGVTYIINSKGDAPKLIYPNYNVTNNIVNAFGVGKISEEEGKVSSYKINLDDNELKNYDEKEEKFNCKDYPKEMKINKDDMIESLKYNFCNLYK